ncbi:MAG: DNA polymerase III subunit delta', partial [Bacteroidota bacterium]
MQFKEIIGQEDATQRLHDAINQNRMPHALLLTGPSGVGKLAFAQAIAQYINCENKQDGDSCGKCPNCLKIRKGIHPDVHFILPIISKTSGGKKLLTGDFYQDFRESFVEDPYFSFAEWQQKLGGESKQLFISVDEIRALKRRIFLKSFEAPYKVVIVWQAELIRTEGANAFLKLLEEPPERTQIIMTCSDPTRLLTTINSRCQRMQLGRIPLPQVQTYLEEKRDIPAAEAEEIAHISNGSIGVATGYLSESSQTMSKVYAEWLRAVYLGDYQKIDDQVQVIVGESKEFQKLFLAIAVKKMRDALMYHLKVPQLALVTSSEKAFQEKFAATIDPDKVQEITQLMEDARRHIAGNA